MQQEMMNSHTSYLNTLQRRFFNRNDLKNTEDYSKHHFGKPKITMKTINVVAAIILDEGKLIFATERGYGEYEGWWEFPGGKIEAKECPEMAPPQQVAQQV